MKYIKKPILIEAFRFGYDMIPNWAKCKEVNIINTQQEKNGKMDFISYVEIKTLEGTMRADIGDFIIRGIKGEIYPCKSEIFKATYDRVE